MLLCHKQSRINQSELVKCYQLWQFQNFVSNENWWISIKIFLKNIFRQQANIGSDNGLALVRWQDIISTNYGLLNWRIYVSLGLSVSHIWCDIYNISRKYVLSSTRHDAINLLCHDDVIKWKHFPRYWRFVRGIHQSPENSPHKGQWRGTLMLSLICVWINGWVNNREAGNLRRYRAHYAVIVLYIQLSILREKHDAMSTCCGCYRMSSVSFCMGLLPDT